MRRIALIVMVLMLAGATTGPGRVEGQAAKADGKIVWRADSIFAASHRLQTELLETWSAEIGKRSQGRLEIKWFTGGQLALGAANSLRVLQARSVDVVGLVYSAAAGDMPALSFPSLPMLFSERGPDGVAEMWRKTRGIWEREFAKWDVVPLLYYMADEQIIYNSRRPVNKLDDLKGLKLRFYSREHAQFLQGLGASPTSVPYNEMVSAAQRGVIDGVITGGYTGVSFSLWDARQKFALVEVGLDYVPLVVGVSGKAWNELPADLQAIVRQVTEESQGRAAGIAKTIQRDSWKTLETHSVSLTRLSAADLAKARSAGQEIIEAWVSKAGPVGKELMDATRNR
jgi:TRAP-type C4-dicarboxylate transport system substrate-binding protein